MKRQRSKSTKDEGLSEEQIGLSEEHVRVVDDQALEAKMDEALGLQMISIRLERNTIEAFKFIASRNKGIGYQTLMRQALKRFANGEMIRIGKEIQAELKAGEDCPPNHKKAA